MAKIPGSPPVGDGTGSSTVWPVIGLAICFFIYSVLVFQLGHAEGMKHPYQECISSK